MFFYEFPKNSVFWGISQIILTSDSCHSKKIRGRPRDYSTGDFDHDKGISLEVMNVFVIFATLETCAG